MLPSFQNNATWFKILEEEQRFLIHIIMTEHCNLSCRYCYQKDRRPGDSLDMEKAQETLLTILDRVDPSTQTIIRFFGGEPLLEFEKIRLLTRTARTYWAEKPKESAELRFGITTNGTLLNEEIKSWLKVNGDVSLAISLDGTPRMHNANRSDSYHLLQPHLDFISRYDVPVKMTIGPDSLESCAAGVMHIHELGFECQANLVFEDVWGDKQSKEKYLKSFSRELGKLVQYYSREPDIPRTSLIPPLASALPLPEHQRNFDAYLCGIGSNMVTIGTDGNEYSCERAIPFHRDGSYGSSFNLGRETLKPSSCATCDLQPLCPECRAYNFECFGDSNHKTTHHCEFVKLQLRASALLLFNDAARLKASGSIETLDDEDRCKFSRQLETALFIEKTTRPLHRKLFPGSGTD